MNYQLELFNRVIFGDPELQELNSKDHLEQLLASELDRIKNDLIKDVYSLNKEKKIQVYIQNHQRSIDYLIKVINEKLSKSEQFEKETWELILFQLEQLLFHLEKQFADYLNPDLKVPPGILIMFQLEIKDDIKFLNDKLSSDFIEDKLSLFLQALIKETKPFNDITYRRFFYIRHLINKVVYSIRHLNELKNKEFENILFFHNFNNLSFFSYLTQPVVFELQTLESDNQKRELLYKYLKYYKNKYLKTTLPYNHLIPSIKDQMILWIEDEIHFLKEKGDTFSEKDRIKVPNNKLLTNFSGAQLSYFYKVMHEVGVLPVKNQKDISRFLAENFRTKKTENLSPESLNSKYYNVEESTRAAVKDVVIKMLNTINKKN